MDTVSNAGTCRGTELLTTQHNLDLLNEESVESVMIQSLDIGDSTKQFI